VVVVVGAVEGRVVEIIGQATMGTAVRRDLPHMEVPPPMAAEAVTLVADMAEETVEEDGGELVHRFRPLSPRLFRLVFSFSFSIFTIIQNTRLLVFL
jgi:hypothetical protein